jgi:CubicO group peptidase (beta-lactamase class C family)
MFDRARLNDWLERRMARDGTPGLGIAVTDRAGVVYQAALGFADLAAGTRVAPHHAFENGSIGKTFTALLLLKMQERGLVDLQAPVQRYLPWFEAGTWSDQITIHHLLTHAAGIIEGTDIAADGRFEVWALRDQPVLGPPGQYFSYSNVGFKILGYVIEEILGESYSSAVTREVLQPLGMDASFSPITDTERHRLAIGYRYALHDRPWRAAHGLVPDTWIETGTGDGSIAVTTADMATFTRMLLNGGDGIVSPESFARMNSALAPVDPGDPASTYGYGLAQYVDDDVPLFGHGGDMLGYYSAMHIDPEAGLGVCGLVNGPSDIEDVALVVLRFVRAQLAGTMAELPEIVPLDVVADAAELAGTYRSHAETWRIVADEDRLSLDVEGRQLPIERWFYGARYIILDPQFEKDMLLFERDESGTVVALSHGPRWLAKDGSEHPDPPDAPEHWHHYTGWYKSYNPWLPRFRIFLRRNALWFGYGAGRASRMTEREPGLFQIGDDPSADRIRFDAIAHGQALRATYNGHDYYRTLWSSLPETRH